MKLPATIAIAVALSLQISAQKTPRILVFSRTLGWHHTCIPNGIAAMQKIGNEKNYIIDTTTNAAYFNDDSLKNYDAVMFLCTTGNVLDAKQQAAFERYIQAGGGYVGVHSATDTEYDWPWYGQLAGAYFESHPNNSNVRKATIDVIDKKHPATSMLPDRWTRTDEWYNYKSIYPGIKVLATLDENTYEGGTNGAFHPIIWYHEFDGGKAFYTGLGHTEESYTEPLFLQQLEGGIRYVIDKGPLDYKKAYSVITPDQNRFVKTTLVEGLASPMTLAVAHDGRIFFTELLGKFSMYDPATRKSKLIHNFPVTYLGGTGLIGVTLDPLFSKNNWIYLYYAPPGLTKDSLHFNLSRFTLKGTTLDLKSEKVLLQVPVQENSGSHHGGSFDWDKDGNLYLSTGDGTSPFPSDGYAPLDERPGAEHYSLDAQRSAGNTNDLKGKILKIHPEPDGTYTIPEGNLFAKGTPKTRPEIYAMGARNPYRIAVNPKTSTVYWGDIGPDAGEDSERGPRGYDEFNQAKKPGNFGWPYFVGENRAYTKWDFDNNKVAGPQFDPNAPENHSKNNTGLTELPPAQPAMIAYPYVASEKYPELGAGGRCAIGGDFYSYDEQSSSPNRFPKYYDGTLFVADWMRNWVFSLRFDENENYVRNEPFMASKGDFRRPIDMAFGKDGLLYMLEYGSVYGADNTDSRLVRIEYFTGNRPPVAKAGIQDTMLIDSFNRTRFLTSESNNAPLSRTIAGRAPLTVNFTSRGSIDLDDNDVLSFQWLFDGKTVGAATRNAKYTYTKPGVYRAILKVTDKSGLTARDTLIVKVGNAPPKVTITSSLNKSFGTKNKVFKYAVKVTDKEDGKVDPASIKTYYFYNPQPASSDKPLDLTALTQTDYAGKAIMSTSDCKSCHLTNAKAVGPSYIEIANRYKKQNGALDKLAKKIIAGGGGSWGTQYVMSAHPQLTMKDTREIVKYIFSLTDKKKKETPIPSSGALTLKFSDDEPRGQYTIVSSYTDKGANGVGPITSTDVVTIRNAKVQTVYAGEHNGFARFRNSLAAGSHKAFILLKNVDLTRIRGFDYTYSAGSSSGIIEVRLDSRAGPVVSTTPFAATGDSSRTIAGILNKPVSGRHDIYFFVMKKDKPYDEKIALKEVLFKEE
jgi:cytochrome c